MAATEISTEGWEDFSAPIFVPYGGYEDAAKRRRAAQAMSKKCQREAALDAQKRSGLKTRIYRSVSPDNQKLFIPQLEVWRPLVAPGKIERRGLGALAITLFDTSQMPLFNGDHDEEELVARFRRGYPRLFEPVTTVGKKRRPLAVTGTDIFGNGGMRHIGLTFEPGFIWEELMTVRHLAAPELSLNESHQKEHRPHVSLGKVYRGDTESESDFIGRLHSIRELLEADEMRLLPPYVQFEPGVISVVRTGQNT